MIHIYALVCPLALTIRYIGKSDDPIRRLQEHLNAASKGGKYHAANWLRKVQAQGLKPTVVILESIQDGQDWMEAERRHIALHKAAGYPLTNSTEGGEGAVLTCPLAKERARQSSILAHARPDVKEKDRANSLANWADPDYRKRHEEGMRKAFSDPVVLAKKSAAAVKVWTCEERRKRRSEAYKVMNQNEEFKASRIAAAAIGNARPEVRAKRSASALDCTNRPEVKAKNAAAQKQLWKDPEYKERQRQARLASWAKRKAAKQLDSVYPSGDPESTRPERA